MATVTQQAVLNANNPQTIISGANLNGLTSGSSVLGSAFSNIQGDSAGLGYRRGRAKLHIDSMAVSSGGSVQLWFLTASDGSVFDQGGASVTPLRQSDVTFVPVVQTAAVDIELPCQVPICATIKCLLKNASLGATTPANTNGYVKMYYDTDQLV